MTGKRLLTYNRVAPARLWASALPPATPTTVKPVAVILCLGLQRGAAADVSFPVPDGQGNILQAAVPRSVQGCGCCCQGRAISWASQHAGCCFCWPMWGNMDFILFTYSLLLAPAGLARPASPKITVGLGCSMALLGAVTGALPRCAEPKRPQYLPP